MRNWTPAPESEVKSPHIPVEPVSAPISKAEDFDSTPQQDVIFQPQSQTIITFLSSTEDEVLLAGGRGGGKSLALLVDPLPYCENKNFRGLVMRRTMKELRELIERAKRMYPQTYPGAVWKQQEALYQFPSGARMEFGYCDNVDDLMQYQGQEYSWIGIDEITQFSFEEVVDNLSASIRSTDPLLPRYMRFTTNPNGPGRGWVKRRFINAAPSGKTLKIRYDTPLGEVAVTRKWLHSTIWDNPALLQADPKYLAKLMSLTGQKRDQWLDGSWAGGEGVAFPEFTRKDHVVPAFPIPHDWPRFRSCDWGYARSRAATLWYAIDPSDQTVYVYREFVCNGGKVDYNEKYTAPSYARRILEIESGENIKYGVIDGKTVARKGGMEGPTIEDQMRTVGLKWRHADQSKQSRVNGKNLIHEFLRIDEFTNKPKLQIFDNCSQLIGEMEDLPLDDLNPEDVDTDAPDDIYDSLRYFLMSRYKNYLQDSFFSSSHSLLNNRPVIIDPVWGY